MAPTMPPPADALQIYLGHRDAAWGVVGVARGDGAYDDGGQLAFEAGGTANSALPHTVTHAALTELAHILSARRAAPITLRATTQLAAAAVGVDTTDGSLELYPLIRRLRDSLSPQARCSISESAPHSHFPWADRALTIATICKPGRHWGTVSAAQGALPAAVAPTPDSCAVCLEDFEDMLPSGSLASRAVTGLYACSHATCRRCDHALQRMHPARCPMCRAPRTVWIPPRP